jgi:iron(II)-dependent oxidoreductase
VPTEAEWEAAAALAPSSSEKRRYPWGEAPPTGERANLEGASSGVVSVEANAAGDSAWGCRQLFGNAWEWTSTPFAAYPGFVIDPYAEYSKPWMDSRHRVLRGGCWATRSRLLRNTWRNFYLPDRRDVFAGFRVCEL